MSNYEEAKKIFKQLIEIKIEINKRTKGTDKEDPKEFFNIRNQFKKLNNQLRTFFQNILYKKNIFSIEFTREQFYYKLIGTNDIFIQSFDKCFVIAST